MCQWQKQIKMIMPYLDSPLEEHYWNIGVLLDSSVTTSFKDHIVPPPPFLLKQEIKLESPHSTPKHSTC